MNIRGPVRDVPEVHRGMPHRQLRFGFDGEVALPSLKKAGLEPCDIDYVNRKCWVETCKVHSPQSY